MQRRFETYVGEKKHEAGIQRMAKKGWLAVSTVNSIPRLGCLGMLCFGLLFRKKTRFVVTFERS